LFLGLFCFLQVSERVVLYPDIFATKAKGTNMLKIMGFPHFAIVALVLVICASSFALIPNHSFVQRRSSFGSSKLHILRPDSERDFNEPPRVFETHVNYPCDFQIKVIGKNEGQFAEDILDIVSRVTGAESEEIRYSFRDTKKVRRLKKYFSLLNQI